MPVGPGKLWDTCTLPPFSAQPMTEKQLEELHRARMALESAELRCTDAENRVSAVVEELREARLAIIMILESEKTMKEFTPPEQPGPWVLPGGLLA